MVSISLQPIIVEEPFQQWDLDFIESINLNSSSESNFILTVIGYFIRYAKAIAMKSIYQDVVINFVEKSITKFGIPIVIIS